MRRPSVKRLNPLYRQRLPPIRLRQRLKPQTAVESRIDVEPHRRKRIPGIVPTGTRMKLILAGQRFPMRQADGKELFPHQCEGPVLAVSGSGEPDRIAMDGRIPDRLIAEG